MERSAIAPPDMETWVRRRRRAQKLLEHYPFAAQLLRLYRALLDVQEPAFLNALSDRPDPSALERYVAEHVMLPVVDVTVTVGPPSLAAAVLERIRAGNTAALISEWLAGEGQPPVDTYLARASAGPVLEAIGPPAPCSAPVSDGECPRCAGLPQVSYLSDAGAALVSGPRMLVCCRCSENWTHQRMTCPGCGEQTTSKLPIFADVERLPHLRADACETCQRYVITVDLRKDTAAVPIVDELVALPLDLHAQERGFSKLVPNLMAIG